MIRQPSALGLFGSVIRHLIRHFGHPTYDTLGFGVSYATADLIVGFVSSRKRVARSQSDSDSDADAELVAETIKEGVDVGRDAQDFGLGNFTPAPDVETLFVFPKNPAKCKSNAVVCLFIRLHFKIYVLISLFL
ncbi:hypothetical protein E3N88_02082 [Mikania micrantha]|uniref:Uncharacterized protein n=1 Tax=Mikania micrantha TaxID=192012 RepID=A0A5N6Q4G7_9ASTR|nr:hypothetical protein E3N88_02082 [Mikania micrantha]